MPAPWWLLPFVVAQVDVDVGPLAAAAAASPRPVECLPERQAGRTRAPTVWDFARQPELRRHCRWLARGYSRLRAAPKEALEAADRAEAALPGQAATVVLRGRVLMALGRASLADEAFQKARQLDRRSLESPGALADAAVAALQTGGARRAVDAYRQLVPRAGLLDGRELRHRAYLQAAATVMELGPTVGEDALASLDEAAGYLAEARRQGTLPGFGDFVGAALALALDRRGLTEEATGVAREVGGPWALARRFPVAEDGEAAPTASAPPLPPGMGHALVAIVAEVEDSELAKERWGLYLEAQPEGPWAEHARKKRGP